MEIYIGIGFIILCLAILVFVTGIVRIYNQINKKRTWCLPYQKYIKFQPTGLGSA